MISNCYAMPDRIVRITEMLTEKDKLGVADFERMQADSYVALAEDFVPIIFKALSSRPLSSQQEKAMKRLDSWDYIAAPDAIGPTIFYSILNRAVENTFRKRLGKDLYMEYAATDYPLLNALRNLVGNEDSLWFDDPDTPDKEGLDEVIATSFEEAVESLEKKLGKDIESWVWGRLHTLMFYHPFGEQSRFLGCFLNIGPFPIGGGIETVNPAPHRIIDPWEVTYGASMRYIADLSNMENSRRIIPTGISGNFMSPHYRDQVNMWRSVTYRPFLLERQNIEKDAQYVLKMMPE